MKKSFQGSSIQGLPLFLWENQKQQRGKQAKTCKSNLWSLFHHFIIGLHDTLTLRIKNETKLLAAPEASQTHDSITREVTRASNGIPTKNPLGTYLEPT